MYREKTNGQLFELTIFYLTEGVTSEKSRDSPKNGKLLRSKLPLTGLGHSRKTEQAEF